jgi:hypothetical protein
VKRAFLVVGLCVTAAAACGDQTITEGLEEPLAVHGGQFIGGALPGSPPDGAAVPPRPTAATTEVTYLTPREEGVPFFGWATLDAVAVAARIENQGDGYWVVPTGPPDPAVQGEPVRVWRFLADFHESLAPGRHRVLVAAVDAEGRAGSQVATSICINRLVPDNGNVCDPKKVPPDTVISLAWDRPVDLDLVVVTPDSRTIAAKSATVNLPADQKINRIATDKNIPSVGYLDRDSNAGCVRDGRQIENVVFPEKPATGSYLVYVNLHDACNEAGVRYTVTRWARAGVEGRPDEFSVYESERKSGSLVALQANGSSRLGTFVTEIFVP